MSKTIFFSHTRKQGRFGKGKGQEYVPHFTIEYKSSRGSWRNYTDRKGDSVFSGNTDTMTAVFTELDPPVFVATSMRIIPFSVHPRIVCLRFELHGCRDKSE